MLRDCSPGSQPGCGGHIKCTNSFKKLARTIFCWENTYRSRLVPTRGSKYVQKWQYHLRSALRFAQILLRLAVILGQWELNHLLQQMGKMQSWESVPSSYTVLDHIDGSLPKGGCCWLWWGLNCPVYEAIIDMGSGQTQWKMKKSETEITMNNAKQLSAIDSYN